MAPIRSLFVCLCMLLALGLGAARAAAFPAYGITIQGRLLVFDTDVPVASTTFEITGLQPGESILAIDIRPATAQLYGLGDQGRLYTISPVTAIATPVGAGIGLALDGTEFGFDFDPLADRIRVVSNTGQNFRIDPVTGQAIDGSPAPGLQPDTVLGPGPVDVRGAAHSNNHLGAASTRLYVIDSNSDQLKVTDAPNGGVLSVVGALGLNVTDAVSFDIAGPNVGIAAVPEGNGSRLYSIDLASGTAAPRMVVADGFASQRLRALAVQWLGDRMRAITADSKLVEFYSLNPGTILSTQDIEGLQPGESILGLDYRPSRPEEFGSYALGSTGRLYRMASETATQIGLGTFSVPLDGTDFGFDFDPVTDRIRVVSNTGQNFRIDPDTGTVVDGDPDAPGVQPDTPLNPNSPHVVAIAYTDSPAGSLQGALAGLDATLDSVVRIGAPGDPASADAGTVTQLSTGATGDTGASGFDWSQRDNIGYASVVVGGQSQLLRVTPQGRPFTVGVIGTAQPVVALAVAPGGTIDFRLDSTHVFEPESAGASQLELVRSATRLPQWVAYTVTGTATNGADYVLGAGTVVFPVDTFIAVLPYTITQDLEDELGETIVVTLTAPPLGASLGPRPVATITIADDDGPANAPPTVTIVLPTTEPLFRSPSRLIAMAGAATDDKGVAKVVWVNDNGGAGVATGTTDWTIAEVPINGTFPNAITVTAVDTDGAIATTELTVSTSSKMHTLSEGATGTFFDLDLVLANPNNAEAPVEITFLKPDGTTLQQAHVLPPTSRTTIAVDDIPGLEAAEVSTVVRDNSATATGGIAVERTMRWDASGYGAHTEKAVNADGSKTWYFAEGSQGSFDTYFLLANPNDAPTEALVEAFTEQGEAAVSKQYALPPHSRLTIWAGGVPELVNRSFWTRVTFSTRGIAERAMYFGTPLFAAGHESAGIAAPSTTWFHAEGATGGFFTTFLLLANPNDQPANVTLTYLPAGGAPVTVQKVLGARVRETINVAFEDPSLADAAVATRIEASRPIVSERSMYWPGDPTGWHEAHNSFGETSTGTHWALAEGRVGGPLQYQTYILLANPGDTAATVVITYLRENGTTVQKEYTVQPTSRFNVDVAGMVPELTNESFGARIEATAPIFVERAMYSNAGGTVWSAGTNATATRLQ